MWAGFFKNKDLENFFMGTAEGATFGTVFTMAYVVIVLWTVIISLSSPIDRAMRFFNFIIFLFSVLTLFSFFGIIFTLVKTGIFP